MRPVASFSRELFFCFFNLFRFDFYFGVFLNNLCLGSFYLSIFINLGCFFYYVWIHMSPSCPLGLYIITILL